MRGRERASTKNHRDRSVELCARAVAVIERQLQLRAQFVKRGWIDHDSLFFTDRGAPIRSLAVTGRRWRDTLTRLPIRYRTPYHARHTSVSWLLMLGENPMWVASQHGHNEITMWTVYAAWARGERRDGVDAIRRARGAAHSSAAHGNVPEGGNIAPAAGAGHGDALERRDIVPAAGPHGSAADETNIVPAAGVPDAGVGSELVTARRRQARKSLRRFTKRWRSGRDSNPRPPA